MVGKLQSNLFAFIKKIKFICAKYIKPNRSGYADYERNVLMHVGFIMFLISCLLFFVYTK